MKIQLLAPMLCFLSFFVASAQETYTFEASTATYEELSGSTSLNNGQTWDDPGYMIPLGFNFQMGTHNFNTIYIVDWSVGATLSTGPNSSGIVPIFYPLAQDIIDLGYGSGVSQSPISYIIEGTAGSQILKIEWNNVGFFNDSTESDFMNFQMWLYEGSNIIEYRYGPSQINNPNESFEGETGPIVGLIASYNINTDELEDNAYLLNNNPANPDMIVIEPGDPPVDGALAGMIPNGTVYTFTPETLAVADTEKHAFSLYPNPAKDKVTIASDFELLQLKIYSSNGRYTQTYTDPQNTVDVSSLSSGVYFVEVVTQSGKATRKLLIH